MAVFKVDAFRPLAEFKKEVGEFARYLKATPKAEPREPIERRRRTRRWGGGVIDVKRLDE